MPEITFWTGVFILIVLSMLLRFILSLARMRAGKQQRVSAQEEWQLMQELQAGMTRMEERVASLEELITQEDSGRRSA